MLLGKDNPNIFIKRLISCKKALFIIFFTAVLFSGVAIRIWGVNLSTERTEDENVYAFYASGIAEGGVSSTKILVEGYNQQSRFWAYPPPIRIGYLYPAAFLMGLTGRHDATTLAFMSCFFSILSLFLLAVLSFRFLNRWATLIAVALFAASPMDIAIARRGWQDGMVGFFGLVLIWLCCEISSKPRRKSFYVFFWLAGGYSLLIKESALVIYGLCVLWILSVLVFKEKNTEGALKFGLLSFSAAVTGYMILVSQVGGVAKVIETLTNTAGSLSVNPYVIRTQTGPWYYAWEAFGILTPVVTLFAILGTLMSVFSVFFRDLFSKEKDGNILVIWCCMFFVITLTGVSAVPQYLKNIRFLTVLFYPLYIMSAIGMWRIGRYIHNRRGKVPSGSLIFSGALILCCIVAMDLASFNHIFVEHGVKDPVNPLLRHYSRYKLFSKGDGPDSRAAK